MIRVIFLILTLFVLLQCKIDRQKVSSRTGFTLDDRMYKLECINETLKDTVISIAINLETNSAQINLSRRVNIGVSLKLDDTGNLKLYGMNFFKLNAPFGHRTSINLDSSNLFFPLKMKSSIEENLVNTSLQFIETKTGIVFTDELTGAEALGKTLLDFHYFKELDGHRFLITESVQDSRRNETVSIVREK